MHDAARRTQWAAADKYVGPSKIPDEIVAIG